MKEDDDLDFSIQTKDAGLRKVKNALAWLAHAPMDGKEWHRPDGVSSGSSISTHLQRPGILAGGGSLQWSRRREYPDQPPLEAARADGRLQSYRRHYRVFVKPENLRRKACQILRFFYHGSDYSRRPPLIGRWRRIGGG
jgi:hypothetical protein